jgi:asparagine synthase (glutamine-hydrolysing)
MCGIFSAISWTRPFQQYDQTKFDASLNTMAHRGPDNGSSEILSTSSVGEDKFHIYLGHRRLSIIDLNKQSHQPFKQDGYQIIYNGEVFNYIELRKELEGDYLFTTDSDTEVILRAYQKWGSSCFGRFNGFWAFVIYDPNNNCIVISRDRFSIKPLFYIEDNGQLFLGSEIKSLKKLGCSFSPNQIVLENFLNQSLLDASEDTFYTEIKRFPSMHNWTIDLKTGEKKVERYWEYSRIDYAPDFAGRMEQFRALLMDALRLRLRSDVPLGTLLSGGLDSSAITTLIHTQLNDQVQSYSVVSNEKKYSEESFVDILASSKGIHNHKLRFNNELALDHIGRVLDVQDEPFGSLSVVAQYLLFDKIRKESEIKVLLSGQGADEVLLGYKKFFFLYLKEMMKKKQMGKLIRTVGASYVKGTTIHEFSWKQAKRYLPGKTNTGTDYFKKEFNDVELWSYNNMSERQIQDIDLYSVPALAHYEDRNSMAHSIEVRLPFLDYRLVNFLVHTPIEDKLQGGWTKYILRQAIDELPREIRWRKDKTGFVTPEEKWMRGVLGQQIIEYFSEPSRLDEMGILDKNKFITAIKGFRESSKWLDHSDIFNVYITEMWLREKL